MESCVVKPKETHSPAKHHLVLVKESSEGLASVVGLALLELLGAELLLGESSGVRVEAELHLEVLERVLLLYNTTLGDGTATDGAEDLLDVAGVDDLAQVGLLHDGGREEEVLLERRGLGGGSVDGVKSTESGGGPDDEATEVATGGELEEVHRVDR
jgi:hypothetical protein